MKLTTNLELRKPEYTDPVDIADYNYNSDKLDAAIAKKTDKTYVDNKVKTDVPLNAKFTDTNTTYSAGANIQITGTTISATDTIVTKAKTARFVIGTSTAGYTNSDVDYLCDGTADQTEINAAITALPATGGEIVILDGTYNITATLNVTKDNVNIRGNGNATILKRMFSESLLTKGFIRVTGEDITITRVSFDGNMGSYSGSKDAGLESQGTRTSIMECYFYNSVKSLRVNGAVNILISGNIFYDNGIAISPESNSKCFITGNSFESNNIGVDSAYGGNASRRLSCTSNMFINNNRGIYVWENVGKITNNYIIRGAGTVEDYSTVQYTILLRPGSTNCLIANNMIMGKEVVSEGTGHTIINNKHE